MAVEGEDFWGYTRSGLIINRGGQFPLNEKAFALFIEIEKCVWLLLPQHIIRGDSDKAKFKSSVVEKWSRMKMCSLIGYYCHKLLTMLLMQ